MSNVDTISDAQIRSILQQANLGIQEERKIMKKEDLGGKGSQLFDIATKETSCGLCGKLPCGTGTTMLLATGRGQGASTILEGVCSDCRPSTTGQSDLKIHYRSHLAQKNGPARRILVVEDGRATPMGAPLPGGPSPTMPRSSTLAAKPARWWKFWA
jgi:hypothetical protein